MEAHVTDRIAYLAAALLHLDHFKQLNDAYGHAVCDDCLRAAAQAFRGIVGRDTDLVARYGGEELAEILPHTDLEGAMEVAESVRRAIAALRVPHRENHGAAAS